MLGMLGWRRLPLAVLALALNGCAEDGGSSSSASGENETTDEPEQSEPFTLSSGGTLGGRVPVGVLNGPRSVSSRAETGKRGELWVAPDDVLAAAQTDERFAEQADQGNDEQALNPPITPQKLDVSEDGAYSIELPPGTDYSLMLITEDGEQGVKIDEITVESGGSTEQNISEDELSATGGVRFDVQSLASGDPLNDATATLLSNGDTSNASDGGTLRFESLPEGTYTLSARADGYVSKSRTFQVESEETTDLGPIELNPAKGSVVGQVRIPELDNFANVPVYARAADGSVYTTLTNPSGTYRFTSLPEGEGYSVMAVPNDLAASKRGNIAVERGSTTSVATFTLTPGEPETGSIAGHARFANKAGELEHAGILVSVEGTDQEAVTARDGAYLLNDLEPGTYTLNITDSNHENITKKDVRVVAGSASKLESESLASITGSVSGIVTDSDGDPIGNSNVRVQESGTSTITNAEGRFNLSDHPVGFYTLAAQKTGHGEATTTVDIVADETAQASSLTLTSYKLQGQVNLGDDIQDHSGVRVSLGDGQQSAQTDSSGDFTLRGMDPGEYSLQLSRSGYQTLIQTTTVPAGTYAQDVGSFSLEPYRLQGQVSLGDGVDDHSGVVVTLEGGGKSTQTDSEGSFAFQKVVPGNYLLRFEKPDYQTETAALTVGKGLETELPYLVTLSRLEGTISGTATLENRASHGGITVKLKGSDYTASTDSTGAWSMTVPAGNYGEGLTYDRELFGTVQTDETITVESKGQFTPRSVTLEQTHSRIELGLSAAGGCSGELKAYFTGTGGDAQDFTGSYGVGGENEVEAPPLPLGDYQVALRCSEPGWETRNLSFTLNDAGNTLDLDSVELRRSFVKVNQGDTYTNKRDVSLALGATNAAEMRIRQGSKSADWIPFSADHTFTLTEGDGEKSVEADFRDSQNNRLSTQTDTIHLDTTLEVDTFTAQGASGKGENLHFTLDIGESGAWVMANVPGLVRELHLFDNGTNGDAVAGDGVYERDYLVTEPVDIDTKAEAQIVDRAWNELTVKSSNNVVLNTAPAIENLQSSSNVATGELTLTFSTDEPATTSVAYGETVDALGSSQVVSDNLGTNHKVTLKGLSENQVYYYRVAATDDAGNNGVRQGRAKLAPAPVTGLSAHPGSREVGLIWDASTARNVAGYNLYRSNDGGESFTKINIDGLITESYYRDTEVGDGTRYQYKVAAVDEDDNVSLRSKREQAKPEAALSGPTAIDGGVIEKSTVWLESRSPYRVTDNAKLDSDATLVMLPGTVLELVNDDRFFQVEGAIEGYGKAGNPISVRTAERDGSGAPGFLKFNTERSSTIRNVNWAQAGAVPKSSDDYNKCSKGKNLHLEQGSLTYDQEGGSWLCVASATDVSAEIGSAGNRYSDGGVAIDTFSSGVLEVSVNQDRNYGNSPVAVSVLRDSEVTDSSGVEQLDIQEIEEIVGSTLNGVTTAMQRSGDARIVGNRWQNGAITTGGKYSGDIIVQKNVFGQKTSFSLTVDDNFSNAIRLDKNYWGTTDLGDVASRTGYSPGEDRRLYPLISGPDIAEADFDGDGIPDIRDPDTDNDGYSDLQEDRESDPEFGSFYDPLDEESHPDVAIDTDMDGIPDSRDPDDDNDGLSDKQESIEGTNARMPDTDGDGADDGFEVTYSYDPLSTESKPLYGHERDIVVDERYANRKGKVVIGSGVTLEDCIVAPGTNILIASEANPRFSSCDLQGEFGNIIKVSVDGIPQDGDGSIRLYRSDVSFTRMNGLGAHDVNVGWGTRLDRSEIEGDVGSIYGVVVDSVLSLSAYTSIGGSVHHSRIETNNGLNVRGTIAESKVSAKEDTSTARVHLDSGGGVESSVLKDTSLNFNGGSVVGSLVSPDRVYVDVIGPIRDSDFVVTELYLHEFAESIFLDGSSVLYKDQFVETGLGSPIDEEGDTKAETAFTLVDPDDGSEFQMKVDGITNPPNSRNFPNGANDLWDASGIGVN